MTLATFRIALRRLVTVRTSSHQRRIDFGLGPRPLVRIVADPDWRSGSVCFGPRCRLTWDAPAGAEPVVRRRRRSPRSESAPAAAA